MAKEMTKNFGKVTDLAIRSVGKTPAAFFTITGADGKFNRACAAFGAERVDAVKAIGNGGRIWVRGEMQDMNRKNSKGNTFSERVLKVFNIKDLDAADAEKAAQKAAEEEAAAEAAAADQDLTAINGVGAGIAAKLTEAGINNYAAVVAASAEDLDAVQKGYAARAENDDWAGQAAALAEQAAAEAAPVQEQSDEDQIPF